MTQIVWCGEIKISVSEVQGTFRGSVHTARVLTTGKNIYRSDAMAPSPNKALAMALELFANDLKTGKVRLLNEPE
jgi:hypothetical protein